MAQPVFASPCVVMSMGMPQRPSGRGHSDSQSIALTCAVPGFRSGLGDQRFR